VIAYETVGANDRARWMFFLHGILGTRANWRSFARKFVAATDWGAVLVDLRMHGGSRDVPQQPMAPHTIENAARDLDSIPIRASGVLGHSFGGKVALEWARRRSLAERSNLDVAIIVDSTPGARAVAADYGAYEVCKALENAPKTLRKRADYTDWMIAAGIETVTAQWLTMNVRPKNGAFELGLDLAAIRSLLDDYFARDFWSYVESPQRKTRVEFVIGSRGSVPEEDRARLQKISASASEHLSRSRSHASASEHVVDAGHWVHVDAPDALLAIVRDVVE